MEALVNRHLERFEGDTERSLASLPVGESTRGHLEGISDPQVTQSLRHMPQRSSEPGSDRSTSFAIGSSAAGDLRFRVLRPHAQGGLRTVSVALDEELHREVALKEILDRHSGDPVSRQRFLLEAEITGGLEHPGIVPVYGLGTYADGRPFYAMRFIRGDSLNDAIQQFHSDRALGSDPGRRSLELRKLLKRFTDVCNAIEYAHTRGVLHRDIKPGTIIVGKYGETLVVDWGLAKLQGHGSDDEVSGERPLSSSATTTQSSETIPGSVLGTPAYMSPEQARGELDLLGPQSDVYSLGATLYCLLTGQAPFQQGDLVAVLRAVQQGELKKPRQLSSAIDAPLEAICLRAMATAPQDRYPSAQALADEIDRWLADEPVLAYPEPWTRTFTRWLSRHRTAVAASTAAGIVAIVGLAAVAAVQTQGRNALAVKNSELTDANATISRTNADLEVANAKVQARYELAVDAIETFHTGVSEDFLLKQDQFQDLRDRLLNSASDFYEKLGATLEGDGDLDSRRALLQAYYKVADLTDKVGRKEDALALHRRVLAGREMLAGETTAELEIQIDVAESLMVVGRILETTGKIDEALVAYEQARSAVAAADGSPPEAEAARVAFAKIEKHVGRALHTIGRSAEAQLVLERARDILADVAAANPTDNDLQSDLAQSHAYLGALHWKLGHPAEAIASFDAALAIQEKLVTVNPDVTLYRSELTQTYHNKGAVLSFIGKMPEAVATFETSLAIRRKLAEDNPAVIQFQARLATAHSNLGAMQGRMGNLSAALAAFEESVAIRQKLVDGNPDVTSFLFDLSQSYFNIGVVRDDSGNAQRGG